MVQDFRLDAEQDACARYPEEACGLVVSGTYFPCRNIALNPTKNFVLNPVDYAKAMLSGSIEAVVHSHPQGTPISEHDLDACKQTKLPWYIYSVPEQQWLTINP